MSAEEFEVFLSSYHTAAMTGLLESGESIRFAGRAAFTTMGTRSIAGFLSLTDLRLLFLADSPLFANSDADRSPHTTATVPPRFRQRRSPPQGESLPLMAIQSITWTRAHAKLTRRRSALFEAGDSSQTVSGPGINGMTTSSLVVCSKLGRSLRFVIEDGRFAEALRSELDAVLERPSDFIFAFKSFEARTTSNDSKEDLPASLASHNSVQGLDAFKELCKWRGYDPVVEYARLGVDVSDFRPASCVPASTGCLASTATTATTATAAAAWKLVRSNEAYALCGSYPALLAVPTACATRELLADSARFRSKGRLPVLSWRCRSSGATISRCAQVI